MQEFSIQLLTVDLTIGVGKSAQGDDVPREVERRASRSAATKRLHRLSVCFRTNRRRMIYLTP